MGKTPKKAAPGGDERNLYVRRLKATTVPSKASESNLPERQRVSESSNRPKLSGIQKKKPVGPGKNFKSKLRPPAKVGINQTTKQLKLPMKHPEEAKTADMQPELEETEVKLNVPVQKENVKEENSNSKATEVEESAVDKECVNDASESEILTKIVREVIAFSKEKIVPLQEKEGVSSENVNAETKEVEEQEETDIKLTFEIEQNSTQNEEEKLNDKRPNDDNKEVLQVELKNGINEKEETQSEIQTDAESYSVGIVESTTSEISETSASVSQSDTQKDDKEKIDDALNNDASFVSYDSSIMLRDVQIRLNDCLKDNSKLFDVSNMDDTHQLLSEDLSFGKTLRNISGRRSIGRMRHITLRERRISPNSSLFVNTSTMSMPQDEGIEAKVLHYSSGLLSDSYPKNGSPSDRKRKIETANWSSTKKQKIDEKSSLLNTSIGLLKTFRRPVQVSTPNVTPYKFDSTKLNLSGVTDDDNKLTAETTESTKKWCVIM